MQKKCDTHYEKAVKMRQEHQTDNDIARKLFLCYPTHVFKDQEEVEFEIKDEISKHFNISILSVQFCGSAKFGYSYHNSRLFNANESDLDVSIIDTPLYLKFLRIAHEVTKGYSDFSKFRSRNHMTGKSICSNFTSYLSKGIVRPDLMPSCEEKLKWFTFFNLLSNKYSKLFKNINAGIYCNEYFFESKQKYIIQKIQEH